MTIIQYITTGGKGRLAALAFAGSLLFSACTKNALDQKPDITIAVPSTISDYQQLLDGIEGGNIGNAIGFYSYRSLGDFLADGLTVNNTSYTTYFASNAFVNGVLKWDKTMFSSLTALAEWDKPYKIILNANIALEGINAITPSSVTQPDWNNVKGMALFMRGQTFYNLAQFWSKPYNAASASSDLGIVLRTSSNVDNVSVRASIKDTYNQIINDLKESVTLLPNTTVQNNQLSKVRPSKAAAYGMLARTYLAMGDSVNVYKYADSALQIYNTLIDYNTITVSSFSSYTNFNSETVYYSFDQWGTIGGMSGNWILDSAAILPAYNDNDLRKKLFFTKNTFSAAATGYVFVGDYSLSYRFNGIAVDELYLLRAEASARLGNTAAAMTDLNTMLIKRWKAGTFVPYTAASASDALVQIINERKKELFERGCRWTDLRRLNSDPRFAITLSRTVNGTTYTLPPGDSRYTLQIPDYIIVASNGSIAQNP